MRLIRSPEEAAIIISARGLAAIYWDLANALCDAAATLAVVEDANDALQMVPAERLTEAVRASLVLRYLADRAREAESA